MPWEQIGYYSYFITTIDKLTYSFISYLLQLFYLSIAKAPYGSKAFCSITNSKQ